MTTQITQPAEVTDESLEVWIIIVVVIVTVLILIAAVILLAYVRTYHYQFMELVKFFLICLVGIL